MASVTLPSAKDINKKFYVNVEQALENKNQLKSLKVIVAIPAFNEEVAIGSVVLRSLKYADEVYVIDDGSKDMTAEVAQLAGANVVKHEKNGGYGAAIKTCFETAKKANADIMVIIDSDGQHNPDDIPCLIKEMLDSKSDIVIGSRFVNGNGKNQHIPAYRKFGMKVLDTATNAGTGLHISDSQSGFRAYSSNAIKSIILHDSDMGAGSEILVRAAEKNLKIVETPIHVRYDLKNTSSKNPISHGFGVLNNIITLISQRRPLLFFGIPGLLMLFIGTVFCFMVLETFNDTRNVAIGYALIFMLCTIIGVFSIFTGLTLMAIQNLKIKTGIIGQNT